MQNLARWLGSIALVGVLSVAGAAQAAFQGSDNFNDNFKDPTLWGPDSTAGGNSGTLTEINGRLEYTAVANPGVVSNARRPWILNQGVYDKSWYAQMDAFVGFNSPNTDDNDGGSIAMAIRNNDAGSNDQAALLVRDVGGERFIRVSVSHLGVQQFFADVPFSGSLVSVQIAFDAAAEAFSFFWDSNGPTGGLNFDLIATVGINSGGNDWGMDASSLFNAALFGSGGTIAIASGELYADNFLLVTSALLVSEPAMLAILAGLAVVLVLQQRAVSDRT
jgi:hypothetical protein